METPKIYSALAAAKKDVDAVSKNRKNTQQGYSFRGIDDAMDAFAPLLAQHGLTVICDAINHLSTEPVTSKTGGQGWRIVNNYIFRIYADDGSYVAGQADGEAIDYGDKCTTKAQSVALREFLFKTFMVPFKTTEDIEESSHDITAQKKPYMNSEQLAKLLEAIKEGKFNNENTKALVARLPVAVNQQQYGIIDQAHAAAIGNK